MRAESVDCVVTSPPYNVGMDYGPEVDDRMTPAEYQAFAFDCAREIARVSKHSARIWVNVPQAIYQKDGPNGLNESGVRIRQVPVWDDALVEAGLMFRDWIVWDKRGGNGNTDWGSYLSPNSPNLRGRYELILLYFKGEWNKGRIARNDIARDEWPELTRNVWRMQPEPRNHGHPAPFPAELPRRCILLSTWRGDVVLDPFCGSGTSIKVARDLGRIPIGVDLSHDYLLTTRGRIAQGRLDSLEVAGI